MSLELWVVITYHDDQTDVHGPFTNSDAARAWGITNADYDESVNSWEACPVYPTGP